MYIDAHVHLRDFNQKHKETVRHGLEVARDSGVDAVFDMPNTDPPIVTKELVKDRLRLAKEANVPEVFYGLYIGLTSNSEQIKRAVETYYEFSQVVGMKLYAGHSVGNLGVARFEDQARIYSTLSQQGFDGVLAVHAEKEDELNSGLWNYHNPITHCHARPEKAELESVRDQIKLALDYGFKGKMHIAHISSPLAVKLVQEAKNLGVDISCGICPHHFIYDWQQMNCKNGVLWKMNPPLRSAESKQKMMLHLLSGEIDWIETDHAPHTLDEKVNAPFMSGIPGLPWWNLFEEYLRLNGFSDSRIEEITFSNISKRFDLDVKRSKKIIVDRRNDYPFNPYKPLEEQLI
ncbi:MAG: dihydroorotase [Nanoarchaeota archaeon]|mgnify:CR=1 FL=1